MKVMTDHPMVWGLVLFGAFLVGYVMGRSEAPLLVGAAVGALAAQGSSWLRDTLIRMDTAGENT